jgi:hypothetical protein
VEATKQKEEKGIATKKKGKELIRRNKLVQLSRETSKSISIATLHMNTKGTSQEHHEE